MHATAEEAEAETLRMLNVYADFYEKSLGIPVVRGRKTDKEKFAGAAATYTVEALMHDGKALQGGTSHNFGDGFARAFGIQYLDSDNQLKYCHQTSWGVTTRIIGAIIMTHGDDRGLVLPSAVAPVQVVIGPVQQHKEGVLEAANALKDRLSTVARVKLDDSDNSPGWKFAEHEMRGVPIRIEIGPRDIENNSCVLVRRDSGEKQFFSLDGIEATVTEQLEALTKALYEKASANRDAHTYTATTLPEFKEIAENKSGYIRAMWCGELDCELQLKEEADVTSRCMPFNDTECVSDTCVCCGKKAKTLVYWGKAY